MEGIVLKLDLVGNCGYATGIDQKTLLGKADGNITLDYQGRIIEASVDSNRCLVRFPNGEDSLHRVFGLEADLEEVRFRYF